jgi:hypothetical protein
MPRGGSRPGSGRKPGSKTRAGADARVDVRILAAAYTKDALAALVDIVRDPKSPAAAKVMAARELLDRGWGRAMQTHELTGAEGGPLIIQWQSES